MSVLNIKDVGFNYPNSVYVGRKKNTIFHFGNPFLAETYGRELAVLYFLQWLEGENFLDVETDRRKWILENLHSLKNKNLLCFCSPESCHADILFEKVK